MMLLFGITSQATSGTEYAPVGLGPAQATDLEYPVTQQLRFSELRVSQTPGTGAGSVEYTLMRNGLATSLTLSIPVVNPSAVSDSAADIDFQSGDTIGLLADKVGVISSAPTSVLISVGEG